MSMPIKVHGMYTNPYCLLNVHAHQSTWYVYQSLLPPQCPCPSKYMVCIPILTAYSMTNKVHGMYTNPYCLIHVHTHQSTWYVYQSLLPPQCPCQSKYMVCIPILTASSMSIPVKVHGVYTNPYCLLHVHAYQSTRYVYQSSLPPPCPCPSKCMVCIPILTASSMSMPIKVHGVYTNPHCLFHDHAHQKYTVNMRGKHAFSPADQ